MERTTPIGPSLTSAAKPRQSITESVSRLWKPSRETKSSASSSRTPGKTFVVPLFLATSRSSARDKSFASGALPNNPTSRPSVHSSNEHVQGRLETVPPLSMPQRDEDEVSDMYGGSVYSRTMTEGHVTERHTDGQRPHGSRAASSSSGRTQSVRTGSTRSTHSSARTGKRHVSRSKRSSRVVAINAKAKMSFAFGITLLVAVVIYLVLTFTRTAQGTMFHVLSIVLILTLTGIFFHQLISMLILKRRPRGKRRRIVHGHRRPPGNAQSRRAGPENELHPEKPIQIHMATDDGFGPDLERGVPAPIQIPPLVYGNNRTSMRINPDLVHWQHVSPSPLTPTYDEALTQVHQTMGYRPPSYLSENNGEEEDMIASRKRDVDAALDDIHPLERERMRELATHALEGRG